MGKIINISEPWKDHSFEEVETFVKEEIGGINDVLDQILPSSDDAGGEDESWQDDSYSNVEDAIKGEFRTIESKIEDAIEEIYGDRTIPLTFEAAEDGVKIFFNCFNENEQTRTVEVSTDGGETWKSFTSENYDEGSNTPIASLDAGQTALVRGDNEAMGYYSENEGEYMSAGAFRIAGRCYVYGNVMSLLDSQNFRTKNDVANRAFLSLFADFYDGTWMNIGLLSHPARRLVLPATTLAEGCYASMFLGCTSLVNAPALPATTLASNCYKSMFYGCTSLADAPTLPATTLAEGCYDSMFNGCSNLEIAPDLPAPTLIEDCYRGLFSGCSKLTHIRCLATDIRDRNCVSNWTYGVAESGSFIKAPEMNDWQWGTSGVPNGWTIENDGDPGLTTSKYLTFTSEGTATISLSNHGDNAPLLYYSTDKTNWTTWDYSPLTFTSDRPLYLCGNNPAGFYSESGGYSSFMSSGSYFGVSGDIMSLLDNEHDLDYIRPKYSFYGLFMNCKGLVSAPDLPAKMLSDGCYSCMFKGCTSLTTAPELPATTLAEKCYQAMFQGCTSLTTAPELPATTLAENCYQAMFQGCTGLTSAPELLPATTLAAYCYPYMFGGCTGLAVAPKLPATTLATSCYQYMFQNCTSLTVAPELPAITLTNSCYKSMFDGCTNLAYIKAMFTTTPGFSYTSGWVKNVNGTGTFVKNSAATWNVTGNAGVPEGWTVETASE